MPDITMCKGSIGAYICPKKDTCYRHIAEANSKYQSYFMNPPYDKETGECKYYDEVKLGSDQNLSTPENF